MLNNNLKDEGSPMVGENFWEMELEETASNKTDESKPIKSCQQIENSDLKGQKELERNLLRI